MYNVYTSPMENVQKIYFKNNNKGDKNGKGENDDNISKDYAPMQKALTNIISKASEAMYKTKNNNFKKVEKSDVKMNKFFEIIKANIPTTNTEGFWISQDVIDQRGKGGKNAKELELGIDFGNILGKPSALRDELESNGFIKKLGDKKDDYEFKTDYIHLMDKDGFKILIDEKTALDAKLNPEFLSKTSDATALSYQTQRGGGLKIPLYDNKGNGGLVRLKINGNEFDIFDDNKMLEKIGLSTKDIISGIKFDLQASGITLDTKNIGDNLRQRISQLYYYNVQRIIEEQKQTK
jgi:hypothetical protein